MNKCPKCSGSYTIMEDMDGKYCVCNICYHEYPYKESIVKSEKELQEEAMSGLYTCFLKYREHLPSEVYESLDSIFLKHM